MTNEEASKILKSKMDGSVDTSYEFGEAVRIAIKALEKIDLIKFNVYAMNELLKEAENEE